MISEKRQAANRANAKRSTGPTSEAGLSTAAANAVVHGLTAARPVIPGESADEWNRHFDGIHADWQPVGTTETVLVDRLAVLLWRLRRTVAYETVMTTAGLDQAAALPKYDAEDEAEDREMGRTVYNDESRLYRAENETIAVRQRQAAAEVEFAILTVIDREPDELALQGRVVERMFGTLNALLGTWRPGTVFHFEATTVLSALGVPEDHHKKPFAWKGWTTGAVRRAFGQALAAAGTTVDDLLTAIVNAQADERERCEEKADALRDRLKAAARRRVMRAGLPAAEVLDRIQRYEAHLGRQLQQTLNTLERLQAIRAGRDVPPPAAATLTVDVAG